MDMESESTTCAKCGDQLYAIREHRVSAEEVASGYMRCGNCGYCEHKCGKEVSRDSNGRYCCTPCEFIKNAAEYEKLKAELGRLKIAIGVPGYRCPGCGSHEGASNAQTPENGTKLPLMYCSECELFWHLCPTKPGLILFGGPSYHFKCPSCNPEPEKETPPCPLCGSDRHTDTCASCNGVGDCGHFWCNSCSLVWHECPAKNKIAPRTMCKSKRGANVHLDCVQCSNSYWMKEKIINFNRATKQTSKPVTSKPKATAKPAEPANPKAKPKAPVVGKNAPDDS